MRSKMRFKSVNFVCVLICAYLSIGHCAQLAPVDATIQSFDYDDVDIIPNGNLPFLATNLLPPLEVYCSSLSSIHKLTQNYAEILESGNFSDVRLVVGSEKKEFRLHKSILYARCPAIGSMFEANQDRVLIPDESPEVFEQFIKFVYTGSVYKMNRYAKELLILADKYKMDCLKYHCAQELSNLSTQSVTSTFVFADLYAVADLKSKCIRYITDHAREVMATGDWNQQIKDKPDLLLELFEKQVTRAEMEIELSKKKEEECACRSKYWG